MAGEVGLPGWLRGLLEETFIVFCGTHVGRNKNKFCLHCGISICYYCEPSHLMHRLIQVKRHKLCDVVKLDDLKELIDCSHIRTYTYRGEIVLCLRPQAQSIISKRNNNKCCTCGKILHDYFHYCSLTCKVEHVRLQGNDISSILFHSDPSQFVLTESENLQTNAYDQPDEEVFDDDDHNEITPDLAPIDFVQGEGSSSGWSISEIVESCKKKR
ncbi:uncharacterized protein LOC110019787 [Phalaenopsis equestris]|uniref:uncharacterized protein LOC110019787 n=1 Tax=Phalaenopsis equestris TaxID=78828 RepID=UPI0009E2DC2D|nr:uncharacterized protein LOC110019787 [Phalaenopsis equestris]